MTANTLCISSAQGKRINFNCAERYMMLICHSGHLCFDKFNSVAFLYLGRNWWHFTLSSSENGDNNCPAKNTDEACERSYKALNLQFLKHDLMKKYEHMPLVHCLRKSKFYIFMVLEWFFKQVQNASKNAKRKYLYF